MKKICPFTDSRLKVLIYGLDITKINVKAVLLQNKIYFCNIFHEDLKL